MLIKDLPEPIKTWAKNIWMEEASRWDENEVFVNDFDWGESEQGLHFWHDADDGVTIDKLKARYPELPWEYDYVNPNHYKSFSIECIDMMVSIWGKEKVATYCEINAFKYKMRLGEKPDQPVDRDLDKANWYLNKAKELKND